MEIIFFAADATWRAEVLRILGKKADDPQIVHCPEAQGRSHNLLRVAYEARQRALAEWEASRAKQIEDS